MMSYPILAILVVVVVVVVVVVAAAAAAAAERIIAGRKGSGFEFLVQFSPFLNSFELHF